jgi:hypothetical protein
MDRVIITNIPRCLGHYANILTVKILCILHVDNTYMRIKDTCLHGELISIVFKTCCMLKDLSLAGEVVCG